LIQGISNKAWQAEGRTRETRC